MGRTVSLVLSGLLLCGCYKTIPTEDAEADIDGSRRNLDGSVVGDSAGQQLLPVGPSEMSSCFRLATGDYRMAALRGAAGDGCFEVIFEHLGVGELEAFFPHSGDRLVGADSFTVTGAHLFDSACPTSAALPVDSSSSSALRALSADGEVRIRPLESWQIGQSPFGRVASRFLMANGVVVEFEAEAPNAAEEWCLFGGR
jgi:hypothetical protein